MRRLAALDTHPGTPLDDLLQRAVGAWRERHGMSARRFGAEALGDPGFVLAQARGRSVRLGTADRVLVFMSLAPLGPAFLREVEAFLAVTGAKASVLGEQAAGERSWVGRAPHGSFALPQDGRPGSGLDGRPCECGGDGRHPCRDR